MNQRWTSRDTAAPAFNAVPVEIVKDGNSVLLFPQDLLGPRLDLNVVTSVEGVVTTSIRKNDCILLHHSRQVLYERHLPSRNEFCDLLPPARPEGFKTFEERKRFAVVPGAVESEWIVLGRKNQNFIRGAYRNKGGIVFFAVWEDRRLPFRTQLASCGSPLERCISRRNTVRVFVDMRMTKHDEWLDVAI